MEWYYVVNEERHGPLDEDSLRTLYAEGELGPMDLVWNEDMDDWQPALSVFAGVIAQQAGSTADLGEPTQEPGPGLEALGYFVRAIRERASDFKGRARRTEYWATWMISALAVLLVWILVYMLANGEDAVYGGALVSIVAGGALVLPLVAVTVRRYHDVGFSGWVWLLLTISGLIPGLNVVAAPVGLLVGIYVAFAPSQKKRNKWGPVPAGVSI